MVTCRTGGAIFENQSIRVPVLRSKTYVGLCFFQDWRPTPTLCQSYVPVTVRTGKIDIVSLGVMRVPVVAPKQITGIRGEHSPALSLSPALRHCTGAAASKQMCCCSRQLSLPLHPLGSSLYPLPSRQFSLPRYAPSRLRCCPAPWGPRRTEPSECFSLRCGLAIDCSRHHCCRGHYAHCGSSDTLDGPHTPSVLHTWPVQTVVFRALWQYSLCPKSLITVKETIVKWQYAVQPDTKPPMTVTA